MKVPPMSGAQKAHRSEALLGPDKPNGFHVWGSVTSFDNTATASQLQTEVPALQPLAKQGSSLFPTYLLLSLHSQGGMRSSLPPYRSLSTPQTPIHPAAPCAIGTSSRTPSLVSWA